MMLIETSWEVVKLDVQLLLGDWKRIVTNAKFNNLFVSLNEVIAVFFTINLNIASVPSISEGISARKFVASLLEWAVNSLFTIVAIVVFSRAWNSSGLLGQTSNSPFDLFWPEIKIESNWMWWLIEWEWRYCWWLSNLDWIVWSWTLTGFDGESNKCKERDFVHKNC